jgi:thiol-disulfide isomerase/thioredoxin
MAGRATVRRIVRRHPGFTLVALPCVVLVVVATLLWSPGTPGSTAPSRSRSNGVTPQAQNRAAPAFDLPRLFGPARLSLASLRGHVVVLNFWASWCTACRHEVPALQHLYRHYRGTGVDFIGIDHGDQASAGRAFARGHGMTYPSVIDDSGDLLAKYGPIGLPTTYVIDRTGRIRYQVIGTLDPGALRKAVDRVRLG